MRRTILLLGMSIIFCLASCGDKEAELHGTTNVTKENSKLPDGENQEVTSDKSVIDKVVDLTDYGAYLKKLWIVEGWNDGAAYPVSLVITQMEEGSIKGYFCVDEFITFYYRNLALWKDRTPEFAGVIYDGTAKCEYDYKNGSVGSLSITFCENDRIEVRLDGNEKQSHLLKPYNVSDVEFLDEPTTIEVELDSWGMVTYFPDFPDEYQYKCYFYQMEEGVFYVDWFSVIERLANEEYEINICFAHSSHVYGDFPKEPSVCQVGKRLLEVSVSVGSPACYTFYIDKEDARESDMYFNPILVGDKYVAYMEDGKLILSDIFYTDQQEDLLYMTIVRDFTKTADPMSAIVGIDLIDSESIELTYLVGNDYTEVTEIIPIEKDTKPEQSATADSSSPVVLEMA